VQFFSHSCSPGRNQPAPHPSAMKKSPVKWLTDDAYTALPVHLRAVAVADSQVGVRERGGANKGPEVQEYQRVAGLGESGGFAWCACFVYWCLIKAGANPKMLPIRGEVAAVRNWVAWAWMGKKTVQTPERGDLFFWLDKRQRGHIGFVISKPIAGVFRTIEGNTDGESGSREGDGVYKRTRTTWGLKKNNQSGFIRLGKIE